MIDEMGKWQTLAVAQQDRMDKKLAHFVIDIEALTWTNQRTIFFTGTQKPPL